MFYQELFMQFSKNKENDLKKVWLVERSPHTCLEVLGRHFLEQNILVDWEYSLLSRYYARIKYVPGHILYIQFSAL